MLRMLQACDGVASGCANGMIRLRNRTAFQTLVFGTATSPVFFESFRFMMEKCLVRQLLDRLQGGDSVEQVGQNLPAYDRGSTKVTSAASFTKNQRAASIFPNDFAGAHLLSPVQVYGDGNCLFRAASVLAKGNEDSHLELRLRTALEIGEKTGFYAARLSALANSAISKPSATPGFSASSLL